MPGQAASRLPWRSTPILTDWNIQVKVSTIVLTETLIRLAKGVISALERWLQEAKQGM